jgi:hypothetical protein
MANFVDENELHEGSVDEEISQVTEQPQESQVQETPAQEEPEELPEKYKGKSAAEIVKMHQEAEKMIGRQAQEVHEVRSLADQLLKQQLESNNTKQTTEQTQEEDFFADPQSAVNRTVDQHPAVLAAKQASFDMKRMQTGQQLAAKHPDYAEIAQNADFQNWVKASPFRIDLFTKADAEFDFPAADELLSTFKEIRQVKSAQQSSQMKAVEAKAQDTALKAASVDVGGSGEVSRKIYRRADLIKLKMTDPDRYMALQDEIMSAYADGRVK